MLLSFPTWIGEISIRRLLESRLPNGNFVRFPVLWGSELVPFLQHLIVFPSFRFDFL